MLQKTSHFMRQANFIGGEWVQADSGATVDVNNPATGLVDRHRAEIRQGRDAPRHRGGRTPRSSRWKKTSVLERHKLLRKLHDAIMDNVSSRWPSC